MLERLARRSVLFCLILATTAVAACSGKIETRTLELGVAVGTTASGGAAPLEVTLTAVPTGEWQPDQFTWSFGDGTDALVSAETVVTHEFRTPGTFQVSVTASETGAARSATSDPITIVVSEGAPLAVAPSAAPDEGVVPLTASFSANVTGGVPPYTYLWEVDEDTRSDAAEPSFTFGAAGSYTVDLTVTDGAGSQADGSVTVEALDEGANSAPTANDDTATTDEDTPANVDVLANDDDIDGDSLIVTAVGDPDHGAATIISDGALVRYTPAANYYGADSFTVTVEDPDGASDTSSVTVTVTSVNDAPVASDDTASTDEDVATDIDVLANDSDPEGDTVTIATVGDPDHGTTTIINDGALVRYSPAANYHGADSFTVTIEDLGGASDTATVSVTVTPINDGPTADDDTATTDEDVAADIDVLANDGDPDGDTLIITAVGDPDHGTATIVSDGALVRYTPAANYHGADSFTVTVEDPDGISDTATVAVTVTPVNDGPTAADDTATTDEDVAADVDVLANDDDIDGDTLIVTAVGDPTHGTATIISDGTLVRYSPDANYHGADSFTVTIEDPDGASDSAGVAVTVTSINDAPTITNPGALTLSPAEPTLSTPLVLAAQPTTNDIDGDTVTLRYSWEKRASAGGDWTEVVGDSGVATVPALGVEHLVRASSYRLVVTPDDGTDTGPPVATELVVVANVSPSIQQASLVVTPSNPLTTHELALAEQPIGVDSDDGDVVSFDFVWQIEAAGHWVPIEGRSGEAAAIVAPLPASVTRRDQKYRVVVTPTDGFSYGPSVTSTQVTVGNSVPVAEDDAFDGTEDTTLDIDVADLLANDHDDDPDDSVSVANVEAPSHGSVSLVTEGDTTWARFVPEADYAGAAGFQVAIWDGTAPDFSQVTVNLAAVNDAPVLTGLTELTIAEDETATLGAGDLGLTDIDAGTNDLEVVVYFDRGSVALGSITGLTVTGDAFGGYTLVGDLADLNAALDGLQFTPNTNYIGDGQLQLAVNDLGNTGTGAFMFDSHDVAVTITAVNDAPVVTVPDPQQIYEEDGFWVSLGSSANMISIADIDLGDADLEVTLEAADGEFSLSSWAGVTLLEGDGTLDRRIRLVGGLAAVNDAIDTIWYESDNNFYGDTTLTVTVDDQGASGAGGPQTGVGVIDIEVFGLNDAPVVEGPTFLGVLEDEGPIVFSADNGTALSVSDIDAGGADVSVEMWLDYHIASGVLSLGSTSDLSFDAGDGTADTSMAFTGNLTAINTALDGLQYDPPANFAGGPTLWIHVDDLGNTGSGVLSTVDFYVNLNVQAVNDAPVITAPGPQAIEEDSPLVFTPTAGRTLAVADPDATNANLALSTANGTVTLDSLTGLTFYWGTGSNDRDLSAVGSVTDINAALDGLFFLPDDGFVGAASLLVKVNDQPSSGVDHLEDEVTIDIDVIGCFDFDFELTDFPRNGRAWLDDGDGGAGRDYGPTHRMQAPETGSGQSCPGPAFSACPYGSAGLGAERVYRFVAPDDGMYTFTTDPAAIAAELGVDPPPTSAADTVLYLREACPLRDFFDCADDTGSQWTSTLTHRLLADQKVYIVVDAYSAAAEANPFALGVFRDLGWGDDCVDGLEPSCGPALSCINGTCVRDDDCWWSTELDSSFQVSDGLWETWQTVETRESCPGTMLLPNPPDDPEGTLSFPTGFDHAQTDLGCEGLDGSLGPGSGAEALYHFTPAESGWYDLSLRTDFTRADIVLATGFTSECGEGPVPPHRCAGSGQMSAYLAADQTYSFTLNGYAAQDDGLPYVLRLEKLASAQASCANGVTTQMFDDGIVGCAGAVPFGQRADLCSPESRPCSADEWRYNRLENEVPNYHYWTDNRMGAPSGVDASCYVYHSGGADCGITPEGDRRSSLVCAPSTPDPLGNDCEIVSCQYDLIAPASPGQPTPGAPHDYLGGCAETAGTLCCPR